VAIEQTLEFQKQMSETSRSKGKKCGYPQKVFVTTNTQMKCQGPSKYHSNDIANAKVFDK
jgi:hypothetical protein